MFDDEELRKSGVNRSEGGLPPGPRTPEWMFRPIPFMTRCR
jgi:hypothetical protein